MLWLLKNKKRGKRKLIKKMQKEIVAKKKKIKEREKKLKA